MKKISLTPAQIDDMKHALGFNHPQRRVGNRIFIQRNFFGVYKDRSGSWDDLVNKGLATGPYLSSLSPDEKVYHVTKKGRDVLSELYGIEIIWPFSRPEEDPQNECLSTEELYPELSRHDANAELVRHDENTQLQ